MHVLKVEGLRFVDNVKDSNARIDQAIGRAAQTLTAAVVPSGEQTERSHAMR